MAQIEESVARYLEQLDTISPETNMRRYLAPEDKAQLVLLFIKSKQSAAALCRKHRISESNASPRPAPSWSRWPHGRAAIGRFRRWLPHACSGADYF
jgi:hypothetical protein